MGKRNTRSWCCLQRPSWPFLLAQSIYPSRQGAEWLALKEPIGLEGGGTTTRIGGGAPEGDGLGESGGRGGKECVDVLQ